ncbi:hypothetical protein CY35_17G107900 [Sphagnum magellanicum]|nr:hypothetical protein CY35_17G107900 [Sphagnum magellanicum]
MYAKCGSIEDAWRVFNKMPSQNVVTWSTMILGHVQCGQGQKALGLFQEMKQEAVDPNSVTFVGVLNACATVLAIEEGRCVHQEVIQSGLELDDFVGSSLLDIIHGNVEMVECVARRILEMEPDNAADYGLASNIYAAGGNRHLCENVKC